jgi:hypothetical protein
MLEAHVIDADKIRPYFLSETNNSKKSWILFILSPYILENSLFCGIFSRSLVLQPSLDGLNNELISANKFMT